MIDKFMMAYNFIGGIVLMVLHPTILIASIGFGVCIITTILLFFRMRKKAAVEPMPSNRLRKCDVCGEPLSEFRCRHIRRVYLRCENGHTELRRQYEKRMIGA